MYLKRHGTRLENPNPTNPSRTFNLYHSMSHAMSHLSEMLVLVAASVRLLTQSGSR